MADALELRDNGTVRITWDVDESAQRSFILRRVRVGEYLALREFYDEALAENRRKAAETPDAPRDDTPIAVEFVRRAIVALSLGPAPELEDMPIWLGNLGLPPMLMQHWRDVPLVPSSPPSPAPSPSPGPVTVSPG